MAKLLLKKSSVDGRAVDSSGIDYGELAINYRNGRLFYKDNLNNIDNFIDSDLINAKYLALAGGTLTGNIAFSSTQTVDGRDLSADGTKLDGIASSANNYSHPNHSGDVTSSGDGATTIAADAVTYAKIQNVSGNNVILGNDDGAGSAIQELTAANVRALINVEDGATADQTAAQILTAIKTVDGAASGLDADLLDGQHGSHYRINIYDASGTLLN
tara:strand:- start:8809 stop:9456 length:648 start_codon:yes stop_codon:yes gene_type:complete